MASGTSGRSRGAATSYSSGDPRAGELREILARVYYDRKLIVDALCRATMSPGDYDLEGSAWLSWGGILMNAHNRMELDRLLDAIEQDRAALRWRDRIRELRGPSPVVEAVGDGEMESPGAWENELIVGELSTLLDVKFLARGLERAQAIARIKVGWESAMGHGTGALIGERRILTNHHVLFNVAGEAADRVEVWFNYERTVDETPAKVDVHAADPQSIFGSKADDWAVVDLVEAPRQRPLSLAAPSKPVEEGDRVYIIQHPLGGYKQIGMHHNVVTLVKRERIQYMTDTDMGSSGAPVFNDRWEVIALHHRGLRVDRGAGSARFGLEDDVAYRNQGVRIERVLDDMARG